MTQTGLDRMGPIIDVLVLMLPGKCPGRAHLIAEVDRYVCGLFTVCAEKRFDPPRVTWTVDAGTNTGYVVMDARLDKDTLRRLLPQGRVYGQTYRISSPKERDEVEIWMAGKVQTEDEEWR